MLYQMNTALRAMIDDQGGWCIFMVQTRAVALAPARVSTQDIHSEVIERVIHMMREHLHEPLSLEDMADMACMSPFYFNRVFRRRIGLPPGEFLSTLRLDAAKRLLLTTDLSVTDICFEVGYVGLGSFTTRFTQLVGLPPRVLRQLARNEAVPDLLANSGRGIVSNVGSSLAGTLSMPRPFRGTIFVGLFPRPVPQGRPVSCTRLGAPGRFYLDAVPDGIYYLLAAAFPPSHDPYAYLLPSISLLVGSQGPLSILGGYSPTPLDLHMRPWGPTDPPIIMALPFL